MSSADNVLIVSLSTDAPVTAKLCDFGTSRKVSLIMTSAVGSFLYMAPEVVGGNEYNEKVEV